MSPLPLDLPALDAPAAEWVALAERIPGWRWMPGMRVLHIEGGDVGPVRGTYLSPWSLGQDGGLLIQWDDYAPRGLGRSWALPQVFRPHPWVFDYAIPDPDDPATAGCLWELAGRPEVMVERGGKRVRVWDGSPQSIAQQLSGLGPTLGRALIAFAAANGRWPGGGE